MTRMAEALSSLIIHPGRAQSGSLFRPSIEIGLNSGRCEPFCQRFSHYPLRIDSTALLRRSMGENMYKRTRILSIFAAACGLAAPLWAQDSPVKDWPYRVEVFGSINRGGLYNGGTLWGSGPEYGGGIGVRPFSGWLKRIGFEFEGSQLSKSSARTATTAIQNQTLNVAISQKLDSRLLQGNVLYHFRSGTRIQPFASIGIGHLKANYSRNCSSCVFDVEPGTGKLIPRQLESEYEGSKTGIAIGAGLKFAINRHLSIRSQVQLMDTTAGSGINLSWLRFQLGLGVHF
jgi:opacity protein-like surface antigen